MNAVKAAGYSVDVWDVDKQGVPHDLGVLGHYEAVVWYVGDNRYTQDEEDFLIDTGPEWYGELPYIGVAERQQYLTLAVRDFLNEGGKLLHAGEMAQDYGIFEGLYRGPVLRPQRRPDGRVRDHHGPLRRVRRLPASWPTTSASTGSARSRGSASAGRTCSSGIASPIAGPGGGS